jgi:hypothetical protein
MISLLYIFIYASCASLIASFVLPPPTITLSTTRQFSVLAASVSEKQQDPPEFSVVESKPKTEYAALSPGCAVEIQVGDVNLARKAWKKRRRSGSPLLVPCSILNVDRKSMVRQNILYILQKFGKPLSKIESQEVGFLSNDICLSMSDISKHYSRHLGVSLAVSLVL